LKAPGANNMYLEFMNKVTQNFEKPGLSVIILTKLSMFTKFIVQDKA